MIKNREKRLEKYICPVCNNIFYGYDFELCKNTDECVCSGEKTNVLYVFSDCFSSRNGKEDQFGGFTTLITNDRFDLEDRVNIEHIIKKAFNNTTNNYNELAGVIFGLVYVANLDTIEAIDKIVVVSDSEYVIKGASERMYKWRNDNWTNSCGKVKNLELWLKMMEVVEYIKHDLKLPIVFQHQKGHVGKKITKEENAIVYLQEKCDTISTKMKNKILESRNK